MSREMSYAVSTCQCPIRADSHLHLFQQQHATPQQRHGPGQDSCIVVLEMVVPAAARLLGSARESARSTSWCSLSSFCTMNCARSPTTLLLGVTCTGGNRRVTLHRLDQSALQARLDQSALQAGQRTF